MRPAESAAGRTGRRWLPRLASLLAAIAGAVCSYDFGMLIGGPLVGMVLALNGAVFGSVLAGPLAQRLCRLWPAHPGSDARVDRQATDNTPRPSC